MFTALLDTCVLWPSLQRDFLLSLAIEGIYRPVWSSAVLDELEYHEALKLTERGVASEEAEARARHLIEMMREHFDDAEVHGWEPLDGTYGLSDPDDEHLVAAAFVAGAGAIVTANLRDLPASKLPHGIATLTPQEFAFNTVAVDPVQAWRAVAAIVGRSGRYGHLMTADDVLDTLARRYRMTDAVELLRQTRR
ncbi:MAG: PIN domain-containing protein [Micromonosporaceae bacterium]